MMRTHVYCQRRLVTLSQKAPAQKAMASHRGQPAKISARIRRRIDYLKGQQAKGTTMAHIFPRMRAFVLLFAFSAALSGGVPTTAQAQRSFDGSWSILIVTESGDCDRAYRYAVRIEDGEITYDGSAGVNLTGTVQRNGRVSARVQRGEQSASGTGRLSGNRGTGTWQGRSPLSECGGYWEAERR